MKKVLNRCSWVNLNNPLYLKYHDDVWGIPKHQDNKLFAYLALEIMQAGLSWETILKKEESIKKAFLNFDILKVSKLKEEDIILLMQNKDIIRHRKKIEAIINNAKVILNIIKESKSFDSYIWHFTNNKVIYNDLKKENIIADIISKDLRIRNMSFVGKTIIFSYLEAIGIFNNHEITCFKYHF